MKGWKIKRCNNVKLYSTLDYKCTLFSLKSMLKLKLKNFVQQKQNSNIWRIRNWSSRSVFLNRWDASRYWDLKTFSPGLGTLEKLKIHQKLQRNQVFLRSKSLEKSISGTIGHKTISYRDKRQKRSFYRDLNLKRLRTTDLGEHITTMTWKNQWKFITFQDFKRNNQFFWPLFQSYK